MLGLQNSYVKRCWTDGMDGTGRTGQDGTDGTDGTGRDRTGQDGTGRDRTGRAYDPQNMNISCFKNFRFLETRIILFRVPVRGV